MPRHQALNGSMILLSELVSPESSSQCLFVPFGDYDAPVLVRSIQDRLSLSAYHNLAFHPLVHFRLLSPAIAIAPLSCALLGHALLLLHRDYTISLLYKSECFVERSLSKLSIHGQLQLPGTVPLIAVKDSFPFLVMHVFLQSLILLLLNDSALLSTDSPASSLPRSSMPKKHINNKNVCTISTTHIGSVDVRAMTFLLCPLHVLAVLYCTYDFEYELRYYTVDPLAQKIALLTQFDAFAEPPGCIVALPQGGLLTFSAANVLYFPNPHSAVTLDDACRDPLISCNRDRNVVTKVLNIGDVDEFTAFLLIDDSRILLVSQRGHTFICSYSMSHPTASATIVHHIRMFPLGKTTVPQHQGLFHITENLFLQMSLKSLLILFTVSPQQPHISVALVLPSSPPILDFAHTPSGIVSCQGAHFNSQVCHYERTSHTVTLLQESHLTDAFTALFSSANDIFLGHVSNTRLYPVTLSESSITVSNSVTTSGNVLDVLFWDNMLYPICTDGIPSIGIHESFSHACVTNGNNFIAIANNVLLAYENWSCACKLALPDHGDIVQIDACCDENSVWYALVLWLNGTFHVVKLGSPAETIYSGHCDSVAYSGLVTYHQHRLLIFVVACDGTLFQTRIQADNGAECCTLRLSTKIADYALTLVKSGSGQVVGYNRNTLVTLEQDPVLELYFAMHCTHSLQQIDAVSFVHDKLVILSDKQVLAVYLPRRDPLTVHKNVIHDVTMKHKCLLVPDTHYCICACTDMLHNTHSLELVDTRTMTVIHCCSLLHLEKPVASLVLVPAPKGKTFMVLPPTGTLPFATFSIRKNAIELHSMLPLESEDPRILDATLHSIQLYDRNALVFVVVGSMVFYVQYVPLTKKWRVYDLPPSHTTWMTISATVLGKSLYVADMVDGVLRQESPESRFLPIPTEYRHKFVTAIAICRCDASMLVVSGDAFGNVSVFRESVQGTAQISAFNVGDQVNAIHCKANRHGEVTRFAIIGTVGGGIYQVSLLDDDEISAQLTEAFSSFAALLKGPARDRLAWLEPCNGFYDSRESFGVLDLRVFEEYTASEGHDASKLPSSNKAHALLARIRFLVRHPW